MQRITQSSVQVCDLHVSVRPFSLRRGRRTRMQSRHSSLILWPLLALRNIPWSPILAQREDQHYPPLVNMAPTIARSGRGAFVKNETCSTWHALQAIDARHRLLLLATIFANHWSDGFGPISFLRCHPFDTRSKLRKAFARKVDNSTVTDHDPSKENRYIEFIQGCVVSRPPELLQLVELEYTTQTFCALDHDVVQFMFILVK
jgi:hypothetical protein